MRKATDRREKKKPTDRELGILLRDITGRMPRMPYNDREVRIAKTTYNGADRFVLTWVNEANRRRKLWYHNWRHAVAAAKWVNGQLEAFKGKTSFTFNDAADKWIKIQEQRTKARDPDLGETTFYAKQNQLDKVRDRFGPMLLDDIKSEHIADYLLELSATHKRGTLVIRKEMIAHVLQYAFERGMLAANPLALRPIKIPGRKSKRVEIPTPAEMDLIYEKIIHAKRALGMHVLTYSSMRVAIVLGASYGMRGGEICALRWDDIQEGRINITKTCTGIGAKVWIKNWPKTESSIRWVPITPEVSAILNDHADIYREHFGNLVGHILRGSREYSDGDGSFPYRPKPRGSHPPREFYPRAQMATHFGEMLLKIGITKTAPNRNGKITTQARFTFHALRHWFCSVAIQHLDVHHVGSISGHKSSAILHDTYGHFIDHPDKRQKFERMPSWLTPRAGDKQQMLPPPSPTFPELAPTELVDFAGQPADLVLIPDRVELENGPDQPEREAVEPCPIDVPDIAPNWLRKYLRLIDQEIPQPVACLQIGKSALEVRDELRRLRMPQTRELKRRMVEKRVVAMVDAGWQDKEIARAVGWENPSSVCKVRANVHKRRPNKSLKRQEKVDAQARVDTRPTHKGQLKLL